MRDVLALVLDELDPCYPAHKLLFCEQITDYPWPQLVALGIIKFRLPHLKEEAEDYLQNGLDLGQCRALYAADLCLIDEEMENFTGGQWQALEEILPRLVSASFVGYVLDDMSCELEVEEFCHRFSKAVALVKSPLGIEDESVKLFHILSRLHPSLPCLH